MAESLENNTDIKKILPSPRKSTSVHQLEISIKLWWLRKLWRRIEVPSDSTFRDLHYIIQRMMMWKNLNFHTFKGLGQLEHIQIGNRKQEFCSDGSSTEVIDESEAKISDYFTDVGAKFSYDYHYGIVWDHEIELISTKAGDPNVLYPTCIAGANFTPTSWKDISHVYVEDFDPKTALDRALDNYER